MIKEKRIKTYASTLVIVLFVIQFVPLDRINPPETSPLHAPDAVMAVLKKSCYDCHSHETKWPGPAYIAPVSWAVSARVSFGRRALNFSQWDTGSKTDQRARIEAISNTVLGSRQHQRLYYAANQQARMSAEERRLLLNWIENVKREQRTGSKNSGNTPQDKTL